MYEKGEPYHRGNPTWHRFFDQIADTIVAELAPRTVLDAGCGIGFLVEALHERGVEAWGTDISEYAIRQVPEQLRPYCSVGSITDELDRDYDLIVCIEVLEHIPAHLAERAIENLTRRTDSILFSSTPDGFSDPTHFNVQPTDYWVELFARHGFFRNLDLDASFIAPHAIHFRRAGQTAVSVARAATGTSLAFGEAPRLASLRPTRCSPAGEFRRSRLGNFGDRRHADDLAAAARGVACIKAAL